MSRHRNFHKIKYDDVHDDDYDYYGRSVEEEAPLSSSLSEYMYQRARLNTENELVGGTPLSTLSSFIPEEAADLSDLPNDVCEDDLFQMDDVSENMRITVAPSQTSTVTTPGVSLGPPPGLERLTPVAASSRPATVFSISRLPTVPASSSQEQPERKEYETRPTPKVPPTVSSLRVSENAGEQRSASKSPSRRGNQSLGVNLGNLPANSSSHRLSQLAAISSNNTTPKRTIKREKGKETINLVVVGHVDAGKSTLMGHVLCQLGCVEQRTLHKFKQESSRYGKASFVYAWVLDETEEERSRGVTMDIGRRNFSTELHNFVLLDAPGHKDFIPNMITGASQADAALLVANATKGEFETGFENGGQTREHAMLLRALGVVQLVVAVNKMDTVEWSESRFNEVESALRAFLSKQAGFAQVRFVPVSGLAGENLVNPLPADHPGTSWYKGPCLIQLIDTFAAPQRALGAPLRCVINDVLKLTPQLLTISAKVEAGELEVTEKVYIMPNADSAVVKCFLPKRKVFFNKCGGHIKGHSLTKKLAALSSESGSSEGAGGAGASCVAGEQALITLVGAFEPDTIHAGHVIVCGGKDTLIPGRRFLVRIVVFDILIPIMKGTKAELYVHSLCEPCTVRRLVSIVNKATGEVEKQRPRCIIRQQSARVEIETEREVAVEPFTICKALGRITLRANGQTIAVGIIEKKIN